MVTLLLTYFSAGYHLETLSDQMCSQDTDGFASQAVGCCVNVWHP